MMKREFVTVSSKQEIAMFNELACLFDDSIVRELEALSRGYVDDNGSMHGDAGPYDIRLIIHTQSDGGKVIDLVLEEVDRITFVAGYFIEMSCTVDEKFIVFYFSQQGTKERSAIRAKKLKYRVLGSEDLGRRKSAVKTIPIGEFELAEIEKDKWIVCTECQNIWEVSELDEFVECPECNTIWGNPIFIPQN